MACPQRLPPARPDPPPSSADGGRFVGWTVPAAVPVAALGDAVADVLRERRAGVEVEVLRADEDATLLNLSIESPPEDLEAVARRRSGLGSDRISTESRELTDVGKPPARRLLTSFDAEARHYRRALLSKRPARSDGGRPAQRPRSHGGHRAVDRDR